MAEIVRNRTLRPSSRDAISSYKVDTRKVSQGDKLIINIDHESEDLYQQYEIDGYLVKDKNSIHFMAIKNAGKWEISWSGASPKRIK